jgi:hypothetical protein
MKALARELEARIREIEALAREVEALVRQEKMTKADLDVILSTVDRL